MVGLVNAQTQPGAGVSAHNSDGFMLVLFDSHGIELWRGSFAEFLRDNTFSPDEVKRAARALYRGEEWKFGGGAAPVYILRRANPAPARRALRLRPALVGMDSLEGSFACMVEGDADWNGFSCPWFTVDEGERMMEALKAIGCPKAEYDAEHDCFLVRLPDDEDDWEFFGEIHGGLMLYPIGTRGWCWSEEANPATGPAMVGILARVFVALLKRDIGETHYAQVVERNRTEENPSICHSHDFCDANEVMAEAFECVADAPVDPHNGYDSELWSAAWAKAKQLMQEGGKS